jgi:hypothetical protein
MAKLQSQALRAWLRSACPSGTKAIRPIEGPRIKLGAYGFRPRETAPNGPAPSQGRQINRSIGLKTYQERVIAMRSSRASTNEHRLVFKSETGAVERGFLGLFQGASPWGWLIPELEPRAESCSPSGA